MKALVLVAHADDETLGAGGTICKLADSGWQVEVVILSDGIVRARGGEQDNRSGAAAACQILGSRQPSFLDFPDQQLDTVAVSELAAAVSRLGLLPDLVITHAETDLNLDHRITHDVAKIVARPLSKPVSLLACEIPGTSAWSCHQFPANYYVDISSYLQRKIDALGCYQHELQPFPHPCSAEGLELLAHARGMQAGLPAAEAMQLLRGYDGRMPG